MTNQRTNTKYILAALSILILCCVVVWQDSSIRKTAIDDSSYSFRRENGGFATSSPAQGLLAHINSDGMDIETELGQKVAFQLKSITANNKEVKRSRVNYSNSGDELAVDYGSDLAINYNNSTKGVRQDFVVKDGPATDVQIEVTIAVNTEMQPYQMDNFSVGFRDEGNHRHHMTYQDLLVYDASGRLLDCKMDYRSSSANAHEIILRTSAEKVTYPLTIDPLVTAESGFESTIDSTFTGSALAGGLDVNNDGYCDAVVGSYGFQRYSTPNIGKIDVFYGTASGVDLAAAPDFTVLGDTIVSLTDKTGFNVGHKFGFSLDGAGDVNGDGVDDLIVGAPTTSYIDTSTMTPDTTTSAGAFYIFYGGTTGLSATNVDSFYGVQDTAQLGFAVAGVGDINNDNRGDVAVSAPFYTNGIVRQGLVATYEGSTAGLVATPFDNIYGGAIEENLGFNITAAGDVDGDNFDDIVIGSPFYNVLPDSAVGRVQLYLGGATAYNTTPAWTAVGAHQGAQLGFSVDAGSDFTGDGINDIVVGANRYNPEALDPTATIYGRGDGIGGVFVYAGNATGVDAAPATTLINDAGSSGFGSSVAFAGDVDDDGIADLIVGAPYYSAQVGNEGAVYGYYGRNYMAVEDTTFDWCIFGEQENALLGLDVDVLGSCASDAAATSVIVGAPGYVDGAGLSRGAAFNYNGLADCGLAKYEEPVFLTFPDTITVDAEPGLCGATVSFDYPTIDDNCENPVLQIITPIDSGGFFPVGINEVTFRITNTQGQTVDSSLFVIVEDTEAPVLTNEVATISVLLGPGIKNGTLTYPDPTFSDNCGTGGITLTRLSGPASGTNQPIGVYVIVYQAEDAAGNLSYTTFRVIMRDVNVDGKDCTTQVIPANFSSNTGVLSNADLSYATKLSQLGNIPENFGLSLLFSIIEQVIGFSIPGWVKAALGQAGTGINLAFLSVNFNFLPTLDLDVGVYYDAEVDNNSPATTTVSYVGDVCTSKPADTYFGCRDTITMSTTLEVNGGSSSMVVDPGAIKHELGVFAQNFVFAWPISFSASACVGVPLCFPFAGCGGCLGYRASVSESFNVFPPINELPNMERLPLVVACGDSFQPGAGINSILTCAITPTGANPFLTQVLNDVTSGLYIDPFYYDGARDEFVFDPSRVPGSNLLPEFDVKFGRLRANEMTPTSVRGNALVTSGRERRFMATRVDVFSCLRYLIPKPKRDALSCQGIDIGTEFINIGVPVQSPIDPMSCVVLPPVTYLKIDVADVNLTLRSELDAEYSFNPVVQIDDLNFNEPLAWQRPAQGTSGNSQLLSNVLMDESINIVIPDGKTEIMTFNTEFSAFGQFRGNQRIRDNLDVGFNMFEFAKSRLIPGTIGPLVEVDPLFTIPFNRRTMRQYSQDITVDGFDGEVFLQPDNIPPVVVCNDTLIYLDEFGIGILDINAAFNSDPTLSFDLPIGGTGMINLIDVYPDTVTCLDYPETFGFLVTEDDNCNFDTCQFTVTLRDTLRPIIGCQDIVIGIGENGIYQLEPDEVIIGATDNCMEINPVVTPNMFDCDDVGETIVVSVIITDIAGNTNSCVANVTVVDTLPLQIECPYLEAYPVTRYTSVSACTYEADDTEFRPRLAAPDCNTSIAYTLTGATTGTGMSNVNGVEFELGETTITYIATDGSGNMDTCAFVVIVEDNVDPVIDCPGSVTISTNEDMADNYNCTTEYIWNHPRPTDNCSVTAYDVVITNPDGSTENEDLLSRLQSNMLNQTRVFELGTTTIEYTVVDTMMNTVMCSWTVAVIDDEDPMIFCESVVGTNTFGLATAIPITPNDVTTATINVATEAIITDVNILSLAGTQVTMEDITVTLTSPSGTVVPLWTTLCGATPDFDLGLDDAAVTSIGTAPCSPLGGGLAYQPESTLAILNGEASDGDWILTITNTNMTQCGSLDSWVLEIVGNDPNPMLNRLQVLADPGTCTYTVANTDFDPEFADNCPSSFIVQNTFNGPFATTLQGAVFPLGESTVTWTLEDGSGNTTSCDIIIEVIDNVPPVFANCPQPDIIENAEFGACVAFANIVTPTASDECGDVIVTQIDDTGLSSGSVFPVGTTVLTFMAVDASGNSSTCDVRVIVNDTQESDLFACPQPITTQNDAGLCTAVVSGLQPSGIIDNCTENNTVVYQVEYPEGSGNIVASGVEDASGTTFDNGTSVVTYSLYNQPQLLITEVAQELAAAEGGMDNMPYMVLTNDDYLEITNLGPADYNVGGLLVERFGATYRDSLILPVSTVIPAGGVLVVHFGNGDDDPANLFFNVPCAIDIPSGDPAAYAISYKGRAIDVVTTNAFDPIGQGSAANISAADWTGTIASSADRGGVIRTFSYDNDNASDWQVAANCYPLTIGTINPDIEAYSSNGTTTSLQSIDPDVQTCSTTVTINDAEAPQCMQLAETTDYAGPAITAVAGECNTSTITVPSSDDCILNDVNISIVATATELENITISVISPLADTLVLYDGLCTGDDNIDITFDDESDNTVAALCGSLTGDSRPQTGMLMTYYTEGVAGDWTLLVDIAEGTAATLDVSSWTLSATCMNVFDFADVVLDNDTLVCNAEFTWIHPFFQDNCFSGSISVDYRSADPSLQLPVGGLLTANFGKGGTEVTETFSVGTTTVLYTLVDDAGNSSQCSFDVLVEDNEQPTLLLCPSDIMVQLEGGECGQTVTYQVLAEDNCGVVDIIYTPPSGSYFEIGSTPVVVEVIDSSGNITLCEFNVIVGENIPANSQLTCNGAINLSLDQNCEAVIVADMILEGDNYGCYDQYCITITDSLGVPHDNYFTIDDLNETFTVTITDCNLGTSVSCWGYVTIEEKFLPEIICPIDATIICSQDPHERNDNGELLTGEATLGNCEVGASVIYEDNTTDFGECADPRKIITRTWIVTDADGNQTQCDQIITVAAINLVDVIYPDDIEMEAAFECTDVLADPTLTHTDNTGYPTLNGVPVSDLGSLCMVSRNAEDNIYDICDGSYEILRTFSFRNLCMPLSDDNPVRHTQIIQVKDNSAPKMVDCPADMEVSISPWGCLASTALPVPNTIYDLCSEGVDFKAAVYGGGNLEITGSVAGGNLAVFASNLRLGAHRIIYRTTDDCGNENSCEFFVDVVDLTLPIAITKNTVVVSIVGSNGDGEAKLFTENIDNGSFDGCGDVRLEIRRESDICEFPGNTTYNNDGHLFDSNQDTDEGQFVKFCCADITNAIHDVNDDGILDPGYVKVSLRVWDDADGDGYFGSAGDNMNENWTYVKVEDKLNPTLTCPDPITIACDIDDTNTDITGVALGTGACGGANVVYEDILREIDDCGEGYIIRRWSIEGREDIYCEQFITKTGFVSDPTVSFAAVQDTTVFGCPDLELLGEPTWAGNPCQDIGYTSSSEVFDIENGACYTLVVTYEVVNWCVYKPNDPNWVETDDFTDGQIIHKQYIKVADTSIPVIAMCADTIYAVNDQADTNNNGDICETQVTLVNSASDTGSGTCPAGWLKWQVFVDLWGDGTDDLEYSSFVPINDTQNDDDNGNGVPDFYLAPTASGEEVSITLPHIPGSMSDHKVTWKVTDGCENHATCINAFSVQDLKPPTPYCVEISTALMGSTGSVDLWASDFNAGAFDNCTAESDLRYTFTNMPPELDSRYDDMLMSSARTFTCEDIANGPILVEVYVWDEKGNSDYCTVLLTILDNQNACGDAMVIGGRIGTEAGEDVADVTVTIDAMLPEYPRTQLTAANGEFAFTGVPSAAATTLRSSKNTDHKNGINTLDFVFIQRHILELEMLQTPYQLIAADVSNDQKVRASDLLQLRKLILGVYSEFPANESWRFVDASQIFDDPLDPWPFVEVLEGDAMISNDFIAIKVGDVDGTATANVTGHATIESRAESSMILQYEEQSVSKGQPVKVVLTAGQQQELVGMQLTMQTNSLQLTNIVSDWVQLADDNIAMHKDAFTLSVHNSSALSVQEGEEIMTLELTPAVDGLLSDLLKLSDHITVSEAYAAETYDQLPLELAAQSGMAGENKLYQNTPNPFQKSASIRYDLMADGPVVFTILDAAGKTVKVIRRDGIQGENYLELENVDYLQNGVYFYRIQAADFSDMKKMIFVE